MLGRWNEKLVLDVLFDNDKEIEFIYKLISAGALNYKKLFDIELKPDDQKLIYYMLRFLAGRIDDPYGTKYGENKEQEK